MTDSHRLTYVGSPALASAFVQMLEETGLTVEWIRPKERHGLSDFAQGVAVGLVVEGAKDAIGVGVKAAIDKFRARFPGPTEIRDEDDPDPAAET